MADEKQITSGYAWSTLHLGGESEIHESATGVRRRIISSREVVQPGEKVTKADIVKRGATEADWDAFVKGGSVRSYPFPEMPEGSSQSPSDFVMEQLRQGNEDIPAETAMAMALSGTALVPGAFDNTGEEVKEVQK